MPTQAEIRENRRRWCEALRSGKHEQDHGRLKRIISGKFCCLGVGCDVFDPSGWEPSGTFRGSYVRMPWSVSPAYGLSEEAQDSLIRANDRDENPFPQIADLIEALPITGASDG